jgi:hypothetical protein
MQESISHKGHSCANTMMSPLGNSASRVDSNSSGPNAASSNGEPSQSANLNDAPVRFLSPSAYNETIPVEASADSTRVPEEPSNILVVSPCSSVAVSTGPNVIGDSLSRHSFSLRNATSQETLFIGFAHMRGVKKAQWLTSRFEWKFTHSMADLLAVVEQLNATCEVRS